MTLNKLIEVLQERVRKNPRLGNSEPTIGIMRQVPDARRAIGWRRETTFAKLDCVASSYSEGQISGVCLEGLQA